MSENGKLFEVESFSDPEIKYQVDLKGKTCTCPAFQNNGKICKHIKKLMGDKEFKPKTKGGYQLDEVISAIQKAIRRGQEEQALFWADELCKSGFWKYMFRRLNVVASEDIGLADPQAAILVSSIEQAVRNSANDRAGSWFVPDGNMIGMVIMYMCRAPKNRIVDIATQVVAELKEKTGLKLKVPDEALDQHTEKGRQIIKELGINKDRQFYSVGAKVKNKKEISGSEKYWKKLMEIYNLTDLEDDELK